MRPESRAKETEVARIEGIRDAQAGLVTRQVYRSAKRLRGEVPEPLRIQAHSTPVLLAVGAFETAWGRAKSVDPVLKDLCQLKVSQMVGCVF
jgi:alkylhydroperoxidase family enzyme